MTSMSTDADIVTKLRVVRDHIRECLGWGREGRLCDEGRELVEELLAMLEDPHA